MNEATAKNGRSRFRSNKINARSRQCIALILEVLVVAGIQWVQLGAHVHLATVERIVSSSLDEFSERVVVDLRWNAGFDSVVQHAESTGHDASRHADPTGHADGIGHISPGETGYRLEPSCPSLAC